VAVVARRRRVDFVYDERYELEIPATPHDPLRGERILAFLAAEGLLQPRRVLHPEPAPFRDLLRVHTPEYLEALHAPGGLDRVLGGRVPEPLQERFLEAQRTVVGGTVLAARRAIAGGGVAVNLGGGLHHAHAGRGERLCAFNDVAVALAERRAHGFAGRALVVDLDLHDPDGLRSIFAGDPSVHLFSIHARAAAGSGRGATYVEVGDGAGDLLYLDALRRHLPALVADFPADLVFYLAGADPAADDALGSCKLTAQGMLDRDRCVFATVRGRRTPLVVLLAGGYGQEAWRHSARSLAWLLAGREIEPPATEETTLWRYRRLAAAAHARPPAEARAEVWGLTEEDLAAAFGGFQRPQRFLGAFSRQRLELLLERTGFLERLRARGFAQPTLDVEVGSPGGDTLRIWGDPERREPLMELRVAIDRRTLAGLAMLRLEWLLLQDPRARFRPDRPRLPGQRHPGLGLLQDVFALLIVACERLQLDGLVFVPSHFHLASQGRRWLRFVEPEHEGLVRALAAALAGVPLAEATHAVASGQVVDAASGEPFAWTPMPMVLPVSEALRERVTGEEYELRAADAAARRRFVLAGAPRGAVRPSRASGAGS
jgi:acetoin utilization deacetylase AcuC-like enzyme